MGSWGWVLVVLLAFGALQLLALRYALRQDEPGVGSHGVGPYAVESARVEDAQVESAIAEEARAEDSRVEDTRIEDAGPADDGFRCPRCGAANRAGFTYCRTCVAPLTG